MDATKAVSQSSMGERLAALEADRHHLATKADIATLRADITWRLVSAAGVIIGVIKYL